MSTDEQDREIGRAHRELKEKERERKCLRKRSLEMAALINAGRQALLQGIFVPETEEIVKEMPTREEVEQVVSDLVRLDARIQELQDFLSE